MFVRFRETPYGLAMSLVETRRENGKVGHEHVASLGSIETPLSVAARIEFWRGLHERLAQLANRLDVETRGKVMGAVHARVPMVTSDEQHALQLETRRLGRSRHRAVLPCRPRRTPLMLTSHLRRRRAAPKPDRRRALELLVSCSPPGCTGARICETLVDLIHAGTSVRYRARSL
jgi:hypothetical protein